MIVVLVKFQTVLYCTLYIVKVAYTGLMLNFVFDNTAIKLNYVTHY